METNLRVKSEFQVSGSDTRGDAVRKSGHDPCVHWVPRHQDKERLMTELSFYGVWKRRTLRPGVVIDRRWDPTVRGRRGGEGRTILWIVVLARPNGGDGSTVEDPESLRLL